MKPVAVIGGGVTGLAAAWELQTAGVPYVLLEASARLGGKIMTERTDDGFVIEAAADSFQTAKPWAWQLCREIGLADRLIGTNDAHRHVFVLRDGKLHSMPRGMRLIVPTDPDGLLESSLFSDEGKERILAECNLEPKTCECDETLAAFIHRRFGPEALEVFGPFLAGIYTGDPQTLSMRATFPQYLTLERKYGSVTGGTSQLPASQLLPHAPKTMFVSLESGMSELVEGLAAALSGDVRVNSPVESLGEDGKVRLASGEVLEPGAVVLTTPAYAARKLLAGAVPSLAAGLCSVKTISSATVSLGYRAGDLEQPLDGFGFIVAEGEPTRLLASTWSSTKLPGRAPEGYALLRVFVGGHRHQGDVALPDEELVALARAELHRIMGIRAVPVLSRVFRWRDANTQYEVGHLDRVAELRRLSPPWLFLTGSPYEGVGIPDCIRQGRKTARQAVGMKEE